MEKHAAEYAAADLGLVVVSQAKAPALAAEQASKAYPVVGDPTRALYRAAGLERVAVWRFFDPRVLAYYAWAGLNRPRLRMPSAGEDPLQTGGDFVLDRAGGVVYARVSRDPSDRPAVADVLNR